LRRDSTVRDSDAAVRSSNSPGADCPKVEVAAILHVDASDTRVVWGTEFSNGRAITVRPRPDLGWSVRPGGDPNTIIGPDGDVATFDGEIFRQACRDEATGTFYIGPEDLPDPDRAPNCRRHAFKYRGGYRVTSSYLVKPPRARPD
jgi:hypothetical protein